MHQPGHKENRGSLGCAFSQFGMKSLGPSAIHLDHNLAGKGGVCGRLGGAKEQRSEASVLEATTSQKSYRNEDEVKTGFDRSSISFLHSRKRTGRPWLQNGFKKQQLWGSLRYPYLPAAVRTAMAGMGAEGAQHGSLMPTQHSAPICPRETPLPALPLEVWGEGRGLTPCSEPGQFAHCNLGPQ